MALEMGDMIAAKSGDLSGRLADFDQLPQSTAGACQINGIAVQACTQGMLPEQRQVLVLVVQHVDEVDEALLGGNRALTEPRQLIDDPAIETTAQFQVVHHGGRLVTQVGEGKTDAPLIAETGLEMPGAHGSVSYTHLTLPTNREV